MQISMMGRGQKKKPRKGVTTRLFHKKSSLQQEPETSQDCQG